MREALLDVTDSAAGAARDAYDQDKRGTHQASKHDPQAKRYVRDGQRAVPHTMTESPLLVLLMAGMAGCALAWMTHDQRPDRDARLPDHRRTSRGYTPHRER